MPKRAVFLDRDKTIIADPGYIDDPDLVSLLPGAAESIVRLNRAGYAVVVVSNQSGVARGKVTEEQLGEIHERLREVLLEQGAKLDAIYYCPYLDGPAAVIERYRKDSELRKPNPGMILKAAEELDLAPAESWMVGDATRDVIAGERAGCRTVLIRHDGDSTPEKSCKPDAIVGSLAEAVEFVLTQPVESGKVGKSESETEGVSRVASSQGREVETQENDTEPGPAVNASVASAEVGERVETWESETERCVSPDSSGKRETVNKPESQDNDASERTLLGTGGRSDDEAAALLTEIRDILKRGERAKRYEDFSVARLVGTVAQMLALVAGAWGVMGLFDGSHEGLPRMSLAIFLQLAALTALLGGGRR